MDFRYVLKESWPLLGWLVHCSKGDRSATVYHGSGVETNSDWFCEAVWDAPFLDGGFDATDIIAGSGACIRGDSIVFVPSGTTVDRIQWIEDEHSIYVSNSLICLLAFIDAAVDPIYRQYATDANSITAGLSGYKSTLQTSRGDIRLVYFNNLIWDRNGCRIQSKPGLGRDFSSFEKYHEFLKRSMAALMNNLSSQARKFVLKPLGTLSSGYDSTTIAVLGKQYGLEEVITFQRSRGGDDDSGAAAAKRLNLRVHSVDREEWRKIKFAEVAFIASYSSAEDMVFLAAEKHLHGRVLLTGYHGDKVWDKNTPYLSDQIVRGDPSGLALTEYRLSAGFINCAVPFFGTRQIRDIHAISNAQVMKAWDVPGDYSRPICRRIAEEAGLLRESFGISKKAVTVSGSDSFDPTGNFLTADAQADYLHWLSTHRMNWFRRLKMPPIPNAKVNFLVNSLFMRLSDMTRWIARTTPLWRCVSDSEFQPRYLSRYLFPWAADRMKQRYRP